MLSQCTLLHISPELFLSYLSPRHVQNLMKANRHWQEVVRGCEPYWLQVAAHLVWRNASASIHLSRFFELTYIPEGYKGAMEAVNKLIRIEIQERAKFTPSGDVHADRMAMEYVNYWAPLADASLHSQTWGYMQFSTHYFKMGTVVLPWIDVCRRLTILSLEHEYGYVAARKAFRQEKIPDLRRFMRKFGDHPISTFSKVRLASKLHNIIFEGHEGIVELLHIGLEVLLEPHLDGRILAATMYRRMKESPFFMQYHAFRLKIWLVFFHKFRARDLCTDLYRVLGKDKDGQRIQRGYLARVLFILKCHSWER